MSTESRPGLLQLAGREAPALYVIGLLATVVGASALVAGIAGAGAALVVLALLLVGVGGIALSGASALQRRVDTPAAGWRGPGPLAIFWTTIPWALLAQLLVAALLTALGAATALSTPLGTLALAAASNLATVLIVGLVVVGSGAVRWRDLILATPAASPSTLPAPDRRGGLAGDLFWGVALALPILSAAGLFATLVMNGTGLSAPVVLPPTLNAVDLAANVLTAGLIAPIGEELLYRGVIAQAWARQSSARRAILFSAIVFAFAHTLTVGGTSVGDAASVAVVAFAVRLPLGIALGWLWIRRRSLVATIALHASYNLAIVAVVALS
ncbi:MAG: CPBP family intramembrane metalloprotease [Chloroflexi bacterium]|nr:CPBP family intramembrane metalloprotease [Chloroflexota bacterium]